MNRLASIVSLALASHAFAINVPTVCDVVEGPFFKKELNLSITSATCGSPIPRPCARFRYYVPRYYIEVVEQPKQSFFTGLLGVRFQLFWVANRVPFGAVNNQGSYSYHAHVIPVPFSEYLFSGMACQGGQPNLFCLSAMSEHLGALWTTGAGDLYQPKFQAWAANPKACLKLGATTSASGSWAPAGSGAPTCSANLSWLPHFPPSPQPICTGWGQHFPRSGTVMSSDHVTASLVIASRIKSLAAEVFQGAVISPEEKWQMILPSHTPSFQEGQNVAYLRARGVNERGRLRGRSARNFLYVVWQKVSCKQDIPAIATTKAWVAGMKSLCEAL